MSALNGRACIMGVWVELVQMSVGHYGIEIKRSTHTSSTGAPHNEISINTLDLCWVAF